jgi:hypothetical protein
MMGPVRSLPGAKPIRVKRSHDENQERSYIAASRHSDRSLEARIESAHCVSRVHKRRTGRYLWITGQQVASEAMYEEEDYDLIRRYRLLTAYMQSQISNDGFASHIATSNGAMCNPLYHNNSHASKGNHLANPGQSIGLNMIQCRL